MRLAVYPFNFRRNYESKICVRYAQCKTCGNAIDRKEGQIHENIIERTIYLSKEKFIHSRSHLFDDNDKLINYRNEMYVDENKVWHVLLDNCRYFNPSLQ